MQIKTVVVTGAGAGTGIGQAVAYRLAKEGFQVVLVYAHSEAGAISTRDNIHASGGKAMLYQADITCESEVSDLFAFVNAEVECLHGVVNNAGIGSFGLMAEITTEAYHRVFNTNCFGTFLMCRAAARHVQDGGRIVNISTGITVSSQGGMGLYVASKSAVEGFTKTLAHELGRRGITANTVSPGMTDTPLLKGGDIGRLKKLGAAGSVMKRLGQPEDIADVVNFLISDEGRWITGQNIHADGGSVIV